MLGRVTAASVAVTVILMVVASWRNVLDVTPARLDGVSMALFVSGFVSTLLLFAWSAGLDLPNDEE